MISAEYSASHGPRNAGGQFPAVDDPADNVPQNPNHRWTRTLDAQQEQLAHVLSDGMQHSLKDHAGLLKSLLGPHSETLVLAVAAGVGGAVMLGLLRLMFGWRMKTLILAVVPVCLILTAYCASFVAVAVFIA